MKGQNKNILLIKFSYLIHILIVIDFIILSSNKLLCCFIKFIYIYISKIIKSICVDPHFWGSFFSLLCNSFLSGVTILGGHVLPQERLLWNHISGLRSESMTPVKEYYG